jgi:hypothetical protein
MNNGFEENIKRRQTEREKRGMEGERTKVGIL